MSLSEKAFFALRLLRRLRRPKTAAVILAAGLGTRMQTEEGRTKQLLILEGKPLFLYSVLAFDAAPCIDEIVVVVRREEVTYVETVLKTTPLKKPYRVTVGGKTRQASARRGLEAVTSKMGYVAVHDAARCLITPEIIERVGGCGKDVIGEVERMAFYEEAKTAYAIVATGESALYANIMLQKGVI